jgi:hypothetical protein
VRAAGFVFIALGVTVFLGLGFLDLLAGAGLMGAGVGLLWLKGRQGA